MALSNRIVGDVEFTDSVTITGTNFNPPAGSIDDTAIKTPTPSDAIGAAKIIHQFALNYAQAEGTDVASETKSIHCATGDGTILAVEVVPITAPTVGDKEFTVDLQKSTAAGAFATVLSAVVTCDSSSVDRTLQAATVSSAAYLDGDHFRIVVTASGSTGSQGDGVLVTVFVREEPS